MAKKNTRTPMRTSPPPVPPPSARPPATRPAVGRPTTGRGTKASDRLATARGETLSATRGFATAEDQVAESARRGELRAATQVAEARDKASGNGADGGKRKRGAAGESTVKKDEHGVPQARSGGPLYADPSKPPVNSKGEPAVHPPDLADNPPGKTAARRGAFGGFPPLPITTVEDVDEIIEKIRTTDKADVLYNWKAEEKASKEPRQDVIDAINARLMYVQGPPLPPD